MSKRPRKKCTVCGGVQGPFSLKPDDVLRCKSCWNYKFTCCECRGANKAEYVYDVRVTEGKDKGQTLRVCHACLSPTPKVDPSIGLICGNT